MAKRWVRYVMPVMVDVDCDDDKVTRVVTLTEEVREDRDDMGRFLISTRSSSTGTATSSPKRTRSVWASLAGSIRSSELAGR